MAAVLAATAALTITACSYASSGPASEDLSPATSYSLAGPLPPTTKAVLAAAPQTVPVTVQPNASQAVSIPTPANNNSSILPLVTSQNPNLVVASAAYSSDLTDLVLSVMNVDTSASTTGQLDVAGWGTFEATVQPNPSQVVLVDVPQGYNTSTLPTLRVTTGNLYLFAATYYPSPGGPPQLAVTMGNPFPDMPSAGSLIVDW